jgi:hypothetical protein
MVFRGINFTPTERAVSKEKTVRRPAGLVGPAIAEARGNRGRGVRVNIT